MKAMGGISFKKLAIGWQANAVGVQMTGYGRTKEEAVANLISEAIQKRLPWHEAEYLAEQLVRLLRKTEVRE